MRGLKIFKSVFEDNISHSRFFRVERSSPAYTFFSNECPKAYMKDHDETIMVPVDCASKKIDKTRALDWIKSLLYDLDGITVRQGSDSYSYIGAEYRQNSPVMNSSGDYLLYDGIIDSKTKKKVL